MLTASWSRDQLVSYADQLLLAARKYASPAHAQIRFPGGPGGYGHAVDGLEGFARTFLTAGFRIAGEQGSDPLGLAAWYADGLSAGTDPSSPERWVGMKEHPQAKVEAACLALILDMTRPWLWDQLDSTVQKNIIAYLSPVVGDDTYPQTNWVWFRIIVQSFLRSVDGPHSDRDIHADLAMHDSFTHTDGWISDGFGRSYDHYVGWALHLFPTMFSRMQGVEDLVAARQGIDEQRLDRFLQDAVHLVGADGSPLIQGRSLLYRFAAASPFWAGIIADVPSVSPGLLRRAAMKTVEHFATQNVPDSTGVLTGGWHHAWPPLLQAYSGPGSPYWASLGLAGLSLPAEHPVWGAAEEALPVEQADQLFTIRAPGWLVSSTVDDGVVRVYNHGTDRVQPKDYTTDSPLYARLGYSTATAPLQATADWHNPRENAVSLRHRDGRTTHRSGFATVALATTDGVGVAASRGKVHWLTPDGQDTGHGSGASGTLSEAGTLTIVSLVRGAWEIRLACPSATHTAAVALQITGWPVAADGALTGRLQALSDDGELFEQDIEGASLLNPVVTVPTLEFPIADGRWVAVLTELSGSTHPLKRTEYSCHLGDNSLTIEARWPDGHHSTTNVMLQPIQTTEELEETTKENR